jgi:starch-binding outer membrane protein, SusD/RagB family
VFNFKYIIQSIKIVMKLFKLLFLCILILFLGFCTKLDEKVYSKLTADNFYKTPEEVNAGLVNVYYRYAGAHIWLQQWQLQECTTEHGMCRWGDGDVYKQDQLHTWGAGHAPNSDVYGNLYSTIASANNFLETLGKSAISGKEAIAAEVKALRATCYMELCDLYGNVPIVTVATLDQKNLPATAKRIDVFAFVEKEFKEALDGLPALKDMSNKKAYYPRFAKETVQALLAKLYLNAQVYTGTPRWQDCITYCDLVINSGVYKLEPNIWNALAPENDKSDELILAISKDNKKFDFAVACWTNILSTPGEVEGAYRDGKLLVKYGGWGGPATLEQHYNSYEDADFRKSLILSGPVYDGTGKLLVTMKDFTNTDIYKFTDKPGEGLACIKYQPDLDPASSGPLQRNDLVLLRYADVLLTKAEAQTRLAGSQTLTASAAQLVNDVRSRNFNPFTGHEYSSSTPLDSLLKERSREFLWECSYRTDLVRFGKFTTVRTKWKLTDDPADGHTNLFPIPLGQIQTNPNLKQNPGY